VSDTRIQLDLEYTARDATDQTMTMPSAETRTGKFTIAVHWTKHKKINANEISERI
jgi:hypothetical protein